MKLPYLMSDYCCPSSVDVGAVGRRNAMLPPMLVDEKVLKF